MRIVRYPKNCPESAKNSVVALGNFDGIHLGHKEVIKTAKEIASKTKKPSAVMSFEPHPITVIRPDVKNIRITPFREKSELTKDLGIDVLFSIHFNKEFSEVSAKDFIEKILIEQLSVSHVVVGYDFIFGHKRSGNIDLLKEYASKDSFGITQVRAIETEKGEPFSSTKIRENIKAGNIKAATEKLGHDYVIEGIVKHGDKIGRDLGFPTANIILKDHLRPAYGIYAAKILVEDKWLDGVINIGIRPSIDSQKELLEAHIFDYDGNLYGKRIKIMPLEYISEEKKFDSLDDLKIKIEEDCQKAREITKKRAI